MRDDLYDFGVVARVVQNLKLPNGNIKVMVEGAEARQAAWTSRSARARCGAISRPTRSSIRCRRSSSCSSTRSWAPSSSTPRCRSTSPSKGSCRPSSSTSPTGSPTRWPRTSPSRRRRSRRLLELLSPYERLQRLLDLLDVEIEKMNLDQRINVQVKKQMEKAQKEYYLNEKIKAIHQELGSKDDRTDEIAELKEKIEKAGLPKAVAEKADQELKRLESMPPVSAEATVSRNYIDWLVSVPWKKSRRGAEGPRTKAEEILNAEHYGLAEDQGADPRVPGRATADHRDAGSDPLLRRTAGSRQVVAGELDRHARSAASSCASRSAACATRPRSAATGAPTSAPFPGRSSR